MFWQGGGKKRLKNQIEGKMEVPTPPFAVGTIGRNDDELLYIYFHREQAVGLGKEENRAVEESPGNNKRPSYVG